MSSRKTKRLEMTVSTIQQRWGLKALRRMEKPPVAEPIPHISTGFHSLNRILAIGGIPRGRTTEILGTPTSGMATLALKIISEAQRSGDNAAYIDLSATFDPDYAARCEIDLDRLLLVRTRRPGEALEILLSLIGGRAAGVVVFDSAPYLLSEALPARTVASVMRRLAVVLAGSASAPIFLTPLFFGDAESPGNYPAGLDLPHHAAVRLIVEKERWIPRRCDIGGYEARATVLKNTFGISGKSTLFQITFNGVVHGNGTS